MTESDCSNACLHKAKEKKTDTVCKMFVDVGNCGAEANSTIAVWGYEERLRRCTPFYWTGCGGNENR